MNAYLLLVPILFPVLGGAFLGIHHMHNRKHRECYVGLITLCTSIMVWFMLLNRPDTDAMILNLAGNLAVKFRIDGMSCVFAGLVSVLWPLAALYAFEYMRKEGKENVFFSFYTMTYGITLGIAFSANLMTMYMCYEMLTLVTIPLVLHELNHESIIATRKYVYYSIGGAAFAFIGFICILTFGETLDFTYGGVIAAETMAAHKRLIQLIYVAAVMGFGVKAALFPLHGWLPSASVAPTPVTALLHAVAVVKAGVFAIIRITYYSFGAENLRGTTAQYVVMALAAVTIVYGSAKALKEQHCKRRLAYSTVSNLSYIIFAAALMTPAGLVGGLTHMVFHGVMKITLFFCIGAIMVKTGRKYLWEMDGLAKRMPLLWTVYTIAGLALIGIPPLTGFVSKWYIATAAVSEGSVMAKVGLGALMTSALLTAMYILQVVVRAWLPGKDFKPESVAELEVPGNYMRIPFVVLTCLVVGLGVYSQPLIDFLTKLASGSL